MDYIEKRGDRQIIGLLRPVNHEGHIRAKTINLRDIVLCVYRDCAGNTLSVDNYYGLHQKHEGNALSAYREYSGNVKTVHSIVSVWTTPET